MRDYSGVMRDYSGVMRDMVFYYDNTKNCKKGHFDDEIPVFRYVFRPKCA